MKRILLYSIFLLAGMTGCITIVDEPLVTVSPTVDFRGHIRGDQVYITATVFANVGIVNPGNIPTVYEYDGSIGVYNQDTGDLLAFGNISGDGLSSVNEVSLDAEDFEQFVVVVSGTVSASADIEADGDPSNDLLLHTAEFYEVITLADIIEISDYPIVTMTPAVDYQGYFKGTDFYITATISANPAYVNAGSFPILFEYDGVLQIYDEGSGALLRSSSVNGHGLSNSVTVLSDTTNFDGFVVIASGDITCTGDIGSDGDDSNDILISTAEYYEVLVVDLIEGEE